MDGIDALLSKGRAAYGSRDWAESYEALLAVRGRTPLSAEDAAMLADAAWWLGLVDESITLSEEAFEANLASGDRSQAARIAIGVAYTHSLRGEEALASGWIGRAIRLLEDIPECAEHGLVEYLEFESAIAANNMEEAAAYAASIGQKGQRFSDRTLMALTALAEGRIRLREGRVAEGLRLLDEAMLEGISDEVDPAWTGNIYCHLILACYELADYRRAGEWTAATARWCESMPGAGPFMGICRVHRAQLLGIKGDLPAAEAEVMRVCRDMAGFHVGMVAEAHYERGEILRRRGDLAAAEDAFRTAQEMGREPQPGLSLLYLQLGRTDTAMNAIKAALAAESDPLGRVRPSAALVEIALAAGDTKTARDAVEELQATATKYGGSGLRAHALTAHGSVLVAEGDPARAVAVLREALACWLDVDAAVEAARLHLLLADAYGALGLRDAAQVEAEASEARYRELGIPPPSRSSDERDLNKGLPGGLTRREAEVLQMAARGMSNREIAEALVISVRTVERHLATVYEKLGLQGRSARTAAVSFALREKLE